MLRPLLNTPELGDLEDYIRIVAAALICGEHPFHGVTALLQHSITIKFVLLSNLINEPIRALESHRNAEKSLQPCGGRSAMCHATSPCRSIPLSKENIDPGLLQSIGSEKTKLSFTHNPELMHSKYRKLCIYIRVPRVLLSLVLTWKVIKLLKGFKVSIFINNVHQP